jgi:hypothetical protein
MILNCGGRYSLFDLLCDVHHAGDLDSPFGDILEFEEFLGRLIYGYTVHFARNTAG